ncbi:hypothetical protein AB9F39_36865, partial [Rhizobium leguminosarum]
VDLAIERALVGIVPGALGIAQFDFAVNQLADGLGRLSQGDVSKTIGTPFVGRLEQLRVDFNASLLLLQDTLSGIRDSASTIQRNSG